MNINLIKQLAVFIICRIDNTKHTLKDSHIRKFLFFDTGEIEHQCYIPDAVRLHVVVHHLHTADLFFIIIDWCNLSGNILPLQYRDLLQIFRG